MDRRLAAVLVVASACASAPRAGPAECPAAWAQVRSALAEGLARYEDGLARYVATTVPGGDVSAGRARAAAAAERWSEAHRDGFLAGCRSGTRAQRSCALAARSPEDLQACGLSGLVQSFTDDVLPAFAIDPTGQGIPPE